MNAELMLPGYRDFVLIARSGGSEVYRAHQDGVDRPVAVKVLLLDDAEAIARFEREVEITVSLGRQHPHIVTVIDTGTTTSGRPCIVMEYYDLGSLHDRLRSRGPLPWTEVLQAGMIVADALSFAHGRGVLHRDVKPQNILLLPTSYVVADFGIARPIDAAHTSSLELFSVRHASPQVLDGVAPSVADDIWSVGSTLFTLLDGRAPFAPDDGEEDSALAYMRRVRTGARRRLARPDVPPPLVAIIERCLQRERTERFPDATSLYEALSTLAAETRAWAPGPAAEATTPAPPKAPRPPNVGDETTGMTVVGAVSPSAMAKLVASIVDEKGGGRAEETGPPEETGWYGSPPPPRRQRRWRRPVTIGLVALVAGGLAGVGVTGISRLSAAGAEQAGATPRPTVTVGPSSQAPPTPNPTPTGAVLSTATTPTPSTSATYVIDPSIAAQDVRVDRSAGGATVRWRDTTAGQAQYFVFRIIGNTNEGLPYVADRGRTELAVTGLRPEEAPYCFVVLSVVVDQRGERRGVSDRRCSTT